MKTSITPVNRLSAEHLNGTPLGGIVDAGRRDELLATAAAQDPTRGTVMAVLVEGVPVGYGAISSTGEVMVHVAPAACGRGVGKSLATKLAGRARGYFGRAWAKARPLTAGEAVARHADLVESSRVSATGAQPAEVTLETVPRTLFHYTAIANLPAILGSSAFVNRLVARSADEDDMQVAVTVFGEVIESKTTIPGGFPTGTQRDAWRPCIQAASYDRVRLGMTCFSTDPDAEALWEFPAPDEPSVALEVESEPLLLSARALDNDAAFVRCVADEDAQTKAVDSLLETISVPPSAAPPHLIPGYPLRVAKEFAYRFVYSGFGGENEWRLLLHGADRDGNGDRLVRGVNLLSVRVQPDHASGQLAGVRALLEAAGYTILKVTDNLISVQKR